MSTETQNAEPKNPNLEAQFAALADELAGRQRTTNTLATFGTACVRLGTLMHLAGEEGRALFDGEDLELLVETAAASAIAASGVVVDVNDIARRASERAKEISFKDKLVDLVPALIPLFGQIAASSSVAGGEHVHFDPHPPSPFVSVDDDKERARVVALTLASVFAPGSLPRAAIQLASDGVGVMVADVSAAYESIRTYESKQPAEAVEVPFTGDALSSDEVKPL